MLSCLIPENASRSNAIHTFMSEDSLASRFPLSFSTKTTNASPQSSTNDSRDMHSERINEDRDIDAHGESEEHDNENYLQQTISQTLSTNSFMVTNATLESRDLSMASLNSQHTHWALEGLCKKFTNIGEAYLHVALWKRLFEDEARAETERQAETAHRTSSRETHKHTKQKKKKTKKKRYSVSKNKDKRSIEDSDGYETTLATWNQGNSGFDWLFTSEEWCIKLQSAQLSSMKVRYTLFLFCSLCSQLKTA
jgi:hypothetical protein